MPRLTPPEQHTLFLSYGVKLLVPYAGAKIHHQMQCLTCDHIWSTMPLSVTQSNRKYGTNSCPACNQVKKDEQIAIKRQHFLAKLDNFPHLEILSEYDGSQSFTNKEETKVAFRNNNCGHEFECYPNYIINGKSKHDCIVCGLNERTEKMSERNKSNRFYTNPGIWREYKYLVASFTRRSYIDYKHIINPNDLPIGLNGVDGAYQVDHIVSKAIGFQLGIPPELLSHHTNLQMLAWEENLAYKDKFKGDIPEVLREYFAGE